MNASGCLLQRALLCYLPSHGGGWLLDTCNPFCLVAKLGPCLLCECTGASLGQLYVVTLVSLSCNRLWMNLFGCTFHLRCGWAQSKALDCKISEARVSWSNPPMAGDAEPSLPT
jgi:hypothetical protein